MHQPLGLIHASSPQEEIKQQQQQQQLKINESECRKKSIQNRERERKKERKKKPWRDGNSKLTVDKKRHNKWNVSFQQELGWLLIYIHIFLLLLLLLLVPVCLLIKDV